MHSAAHATRSSIRQPPHTAGRSIKGFRNAIDISQVPSPVDAIEADKDKWQEQSYSTLPSQEIHAPLSTTDFVALDQGNASPRFIRPTTWAVPASAKLLKDCDIPLALIIQPFADLDPREESIPVVPTDDNGPARCSRCRAYVNPWCTWVAGGASWRCNLCGKETTVESQYFSHLAPNGLRMDASNRPELTKGTVDFLVPASTYRAPHPPPRLVSTAANTHTPTSALPSKLSFFSLPETPQELGRETKPMDFVVMLDLSLDGVRSGFVRTAAESILDTLYGPEACFPSSSRIAFLTFDATVHFYELLPGRHQPRILVVPDIEDMFLPTHEGLFADLYASRTSIEHLLTSLMELSEEIVAGKSALGGAMQGALALLAGRGGHALLFHSSLPDVGPGNMGPRVEESSYYDTDKERELFAARTPFWTELAEECTDEGVGVSMWLGMNRFVDVGTIGVLANQTGGEMFYHPRFEPRKDGIAFRSQVRRVVGRTTGFNVSIRVRVSHGLRIDEFDGHFSRRLSSPDELGLGLLHADAAFSVTLSHTGKLSAREHAHVQCAVLHTAPNGERRVRVINLALTVAGLAGTIFRFADMDAVVTHLSKQAMSDLPRRRMDAVREELSDRCAEILLGYRRNCAVATQPSQLILPEAFKALPCYVLGLLKTKPLKGRTVSSDVRNFHRHRLLGMGCQDTMHHVYPRVLALHDLDDRIALPDPEHGGRIMYPTHMRASYAWMEGHGIYLIDNEEMAVFWVGLSVNPSQIRDLFGVEDVGELDPRLIQLPELQTRFSAQVRNIIAERQARRGGKEVRLLLARQNTDGTEIEVGDMLVEDQNNAAMSYLDYLCQVHKQIHTVLTQGGSITGNRGLQATPW